MPPGQQRPGPGATTSGVGAQVPIKQEYGANPQKVQATSMAPPGTPGPEGQPSPVVGFFSARGVDILRDNPQNAASVAPAFDPHAESPSIRKTAGVDHSKSVPISRPMLSGGASPAANQTRDFINPATNMNRKIGAPGGSGVGNSMNRGPTTSSYRALTRPNAAPNNPAANRASAGAPNMNGKRPPLGDVTNASMPGGSGPAPIPGANDLKRPKFDETLLPQQQTYQQQPPHQLHQR
jgi:DNA repair and recombination protein RAD52